MNGSDDSHLTITAGGQAEERLDPRLLRIASVVVLGTIMSILDTTITNVALKDLSTTFETSLATIQWVSTGYMLALATVIPLTGWAADRFGTRRLYMTSILLFLIGSALSGAAWSSKSLIIFRMLQGFGGGMIMPAGMTILSQAAGPRRMGRLMGIIGVPMLLGPIFGPILGGWLVDDVSWRWIFFVNLPIGAIALYAAGRILESDRPRPHDALDWCGLLLLSPGLATLVYGLARATAAGNFNSAAGAFYTLAGLALVVTFVVYALRREGALIDVSLFGRRTVGAAAVTILLFCTAFFGTSLLLPLYFQLVRGGSALDAGLLLAAQGVGAMVSMPVAGLLTDRNGPRKIVLAGLGLVAFSMLGLSLIESTTSFWLIELALFIMGLGMGSSLMPTMSAALATLQHEQIARVNSGLNVVERVGGSIGTAIFAVVLTDHVGPLGVGNGSNGLHAARSIQLATGNDLLASLGHAFGHTFFWSVPIILLALFAATFLPRDRAETSPGTPAPSTLVA